MASRVWNSEAVTGMKILVVDVGGSHLKVQTSGKQKGVEIPSGPAMTAAMMVAGVRAATDGWTYDAVSIGYPGVVIDGRPADEPHNLGSGWVGFDFGKAFGRPVAIVNDAAMQALGSYEGGRMLFLGLGTGLGSALVVDNVLVSMELAHLPCRNGKTYEDYLGLDGLKRQGARRWRLRVEEIALLLKAAFQVDYVVLGGGNARLLTGLLPGFFLGSNSNAFEGGCRLWSRRHGVNSRARPNRDSGAGGTFRPRTDFFG